MRNHWLVVGTPENWKTAFQHGNIWGLRATRRHLNIWNNLNEDDVVLFYATRPVGGIIGYGVVKTRFRQDKPLWPQEIHEKRVIWPLRFEFDVSECMPPDKWETSKRITEALKLRVRSGFQLLDQKMAVDLIEALESPRDTMTTRTMLSRESIQEQAGDVQPSHGDLKKWLVEIGRLQKFIAEEEYPFDIGRLDVVWRRVEKSVPTYVFEVQIGGDIYHALAKLKHAFDLWNSHIFLVAAREDYEKVGQLTSGTFHEINDQVKFLERNKVRELYLLKKKYRDLEKTLGIL